MSSPKRVLLINDDDAVRIRTSRKLIEAGHMVTAVETGEEGVDLLPRLRPDLVLIDYNLKRDVGGNKTARDFIPRIRGVDSHVPIVVMSATFDALTALELGVNRFVPLSLKGGFAPLVEVVNELLGEGVPA